jgi:NAD-dependent DNA ligase
MQLKGIGESTAELLVKAGIRTAADLFDQTKMSPAKLVASGYFKQGRELEKIFEGIKATKRVDLDAVIRSLGINGLGRTISKQLANYLAGNSHSFSGLEMEVVGPFLNESSRERKLLEDMMQKMRSSGVEVIYPKEVVTTANTIFYEMTGKTEGTGYKTKDELKEFLKSKGYIHSKIGEASLLLTDSYNSDSSKMSIARKKNIKIKTYRDLLEELA